MSNMSYCRFRNTLEDLLDCEEHIGDEDLDDLEADARERLIASCKRIIAKTTVEE